MGAYILLDPFTIHHMITFLGRHISFGPLVTEIMGKPACTVHPPGEEHAPASAVANNCQLRGAQAPT